MFLLIVAGNPGLSSEQQRADKRKKVHTMVLILDGSSEISVHVSREQSLLFDLVKALDKIGSYHISENTYFPSCERNMS